MILYECDTNPAMWSEEHEIFPPEKILENPEATVVIGCFPVKAVTEHLRKLGCKNKIMVYPLFGAYFYCDDIPPEMSEVTILVNDWTKKNKSELLSLYDLSDEETHTLLTEMTAERESSPIGLVPLERMINFHWIPYFYDEKICPIYDITLVDGGAFTGDSIEMVYNRYGKHLKKVYAFEPNKENLNQMTANLKKLNLHEITHYAACGMYDKDTELYIDERADWSKLEDEGEIIVPVKKIDSVVNEVVGKLYIKMDIEGSELPALRGAVETIKKYKPYMALCTYHRMADVLEIPRYIKSICADYKFYLRAGFHTECYAIPQD